MTTERLRDLAEKALQAESEAAVLPYNAPRVDQQKALNKRKAAREAFFAAIADECPIITAAPPARLAGVEDGAEDE